MRKEERAQDRLALLGLHSSFIVPYSSFSFLSSLCSLCLCGEI